MNFKTYTKSYKLKKVTTYAREHSEEFFNIAMNNGEKEAKDQFKDPEKLRDEYESRIKQLESVIKLSEKYIRDFITNAKKNVNITKVTPKLLRTFIKRIEVYEKPEKYSRTCTNRIDIHFTFTPTKAFEIDGTMIGTEKILNVT